MMKKRGFLQNKNNTCQFIGCLHLLPLPGSPQWGGTLQPVIEQCLREADTYMSHAADGLLIENTHDVPYLKAEAEAGTVAAMAAVATTVRKHYPATPIGIQVLAAADIAALDIAIACDLDFIRAEGFSYAHVADEGIIEGNAGRILRRRSHLNANHIEIFTDIKKKHAAHSITGDLSLLEFAKGVLFCNADGIIVTGNTTGEPPELGSLKEVSGLDMRLAVGSGVTMENIDSFAQVADLLIVGSACKVDGDWRNEVDPQRVEDLIQRFKS